MLGVETQVLLSPKFLPLIMLFHHPQQQLGAGGMAAPHPGNLRRPGGPD